MNSAQTIAFGVLWLATVGLAMLVLLLYRQVQQAYDQHATATGGLLAGVNAPDVEILTDDDREAPLRFPLPEAVTLLAFVTTDCTACRQLIETLNDLRDFSGESIALVNGEAPAGFPKSSNPRFRMLWLSHPPDVVRSYGVTSVPLVYALRGRTVLASAGASTPKGIESLLAEAARYEFEARQADPPVAEASVAEEVLA